MVEDRLHSGNYTQEENKTCVDCGVNIGDYVIHRGKIRCVGCWIEFEVDLDKCIADNNKKLSD